MIAPAIVGNDGVTFTFNPGDVEEIISTISANVSHDSMPGSPPTNSLLLDTDGVKKVISLNGELTTASTTRTNSGSTVTIDEQRQWLEKQLNGNQSLCQFASTYSSSYNGSSFSNSSIMRAIVTFREKVDKPSSLPFEMTLFVGG